MKNKISNLLLVGLWMFSLPASEALPKNAEEKEFIADPVLLNGRPVHLATLSSATSGKVSLVKGNPESAGRTEFFVYLKRAGKIVDGGSLVHHVAVKEFDLGEVLKSARVGDEIVISPAVAGEKGGQKIIPVTKVQLAPQFQWFSVFNKSKERC